MRAIIHEKYGHEDEVLSLKEVERPVAGEGEVLVQVCASSMNPDIWHAVRGIPYVMRIMGGGFRKPKTNIPGIDMSGIVEEVGRNVTRFKKGDEIVILTHSEHLPELKERWNPQQAEESKERS